jgi:hypothetical protein
VRHTSNTRHTFIRAALPVCGRTSSAHRSPSLHSSAAASVGRRTDLVRGPQMPASTVSRMRSRRGGDRRRFPVFEPDERWSACEPRAGVLARREVLALLDQASAGADLGDSVGVRGR